MSVDIEEVNKNHYALEKRFDKLEQMIVNTAAPQLSIMGMLTNISQNMASKAEVEKIEKDVILLKKKSDRNAWYIGAAGGLGAIMGAGMKLFLSFILK